MSVKQNLSNSPFLTRLHGGESARIPCWFMRQAGRYLPEYRAVRAEHSMLDVIRTPELATKVTLQPFDRFDLDAAIIFADILNPLIGMGIELDFVEGSGPVIGNPIKSFADIDRLRVPSPEENVAYTLKAIKMVAGELNPRGIPVIGFSGAPFTLISYLLQDGDPSTAKAVKRLALTEPTSWQLLSSKLEELISQYLIAQAKAGASALQLFDSWIGSVSPSFYREHVMPSLARIRQRVRAAVDTPMIYFGTNTNGLLSDIGELGFEGIGVDWRIEISAAAKLLPAALAVQGNLDPALLTIADYDPTKDVHGVLESAVGVPGHIFNVGHGLTPKTDIQTMSRAIDAVRSFEISKDRGEVGERFSKGVVRANG